MIEYIYKGFKLSYVIADLKPEKNMYKADGSLIYLLNIPSTIKPKKFHAEHESHYDAEHEIKRLLENYADVELNNFYEQKKEHRHSE